MIEIDQVALTALAKAAGMFYILMEAILKPALKTAIQRYREKFVAEPLGEQEQLKQDELYTNRLHSSFRVISVIIGILYVWGSGTDVSYFDVFGHASENVGQDLLNILTTGAALGLGGRGVHFLVDAGESVFRFSLLRLKQNEPEVI